ncbi:MAG: hypothetical protein WCA56_05315, partial [Xanthobacteraceae bacterium]
MTALDDGTVLSEGPKWQEKAPGRAKPRLSLGRVDGFDQDEAESKGDERAVILGRLLASKRNTFEALELADR